MSLYNTFCIMAPKASKRQNVRISQFTRESRRSLEIHRSQVNWSGKVQFQIRALEHSPNWNERISLCFKHVAMWCALGFGNRQLFSSSMAFHINHLELCRYHFMILLRNNEFLFLQVTQCNKDLSSYPNSLTIFSTARRHDRAPSADFK